MHLVKLDYTELATYSVYIIFALGFDYYLWTVYNTNHDLYMIMIGYCFATMFGPWATELYLYYKLFTTNTFNPTVCGIALVFLVANTIIERTLKITTDRINHDVGKYLYSLSTNKDN